MTQPFGSESRVNVEFVRGFARRFTMFGIVGFIGFIVDSAVYGFLVGILAVPHLVSRAISYWVATTSNWICNRRFTFDDAEKKHSFTQWSQYMTLGVVSFIPNFGTYYALTHWVRFFAEYKYAALVMGVGAGLLFNFFGAGFLIFRTYGWLKDL